MTNKSVNKDFSKLNSLLFNAWDENARYKPCGHMLNKDVENLINLLSGTNGILTWIEQN